MNHDDVLIELSERIDELEAEIPRLCEAGRFWWFRPSDSTFHASVERTAPAPGDAYLLDASPEFLAQFAEPAAIGELLLNVLIQNMDREVTPP